MDDPDLVHHLLVVDDDRRIRELLQKYLIEHGYHVTTASDVQEARKRMTRFDFDLLIVDIMMPGEDGLTLTKQLRTKTDVPILVLTARGEPEDRIAGFESGADDYLAKPFEPRELLLRVASILRRVGGPLPTLTGLSLGRLYFDLKRNELRDGNKAVRKDVSIIKIAVARAYYNIANRGVQVFGAMGLTSEAPFASALAQARAFRIYDGPDEVHSQTIFRLEERESLADKRSYSDQYLH